MPLKKRNLTETVWCDFADPIDGRLLLMPMSGKMDAEYQKRIGAQPHGVESRRKEDGTVAQYMTMELDPVRAYEAHLWILFQVVKDADLVLDDGSKAAVGESLFESIIDSGSLPKVLEQARELGTARAEAAEKN